MIKIVIINTYIRKKVTCKYKCPKGSALESGGKKQSKPDINRRGGEKQQHPVSF